MRRLGLFCLAGLLAVVFGVSISPVKSWAAGYGTYTTAISSGNLLQPDKIAVDQANGDIYVTDAGGGSYAVRKYDKNYNYQLSFSISGSPVGIAVDTSNIFVGDSTNKCVWVYDKTGALTNLPGTGSSHKLGGASGPNVSMPDAIAVAPSGQIFAVDGDNDDILIYNADGSYSSSFGGSGNTSGYFYFPSGIAFADSSVSGSSVTQYFYVGDQGNDRVQKWYYVYNNTTNAITTAPTYYQTIGTGTQGDAFGQFFRVSDVAYDNIFNRLLVDDSLQQVVQEFDINGATLSAAFNYSGSATQGHLSTPTGAALGYGNNGQELYVANNQGSNVAVFVANQGLPPSITSLTPAVDTVPTATPYTINYTVSDPNVGNLTVKLYCYNVLTPSVLVPLATQTATISTAGGNYNGTLAWNWPAYIGGYNITPPEPTGDWKIYATVTDVSGNIATATSSRISVVTDGTIYNGTAWTEPGGINTPNYTNYLYTLYGLSTSDYDGDGLANGDELNGTYNGTGTYTDAISGQPHTYNYHNASTDMTKSDSDNDGLSDGQEEGRVAAGTHNGQPYYVHTDPNNPNTDGCTIKDGAQVLRQTDPLDTSTCQAPAANLVGMYYDSRTNVAISGIAGIASYCGTSNEPPTPYTFKDYTTDQYYVTTYEVNNPTSNSVTGTLNIYDMTGNLTYSGGLAFSPHQSIEINPATYTNSATAGSIEISSAGGVLSGMEYFTVYSASGIPQLEEQTPIEMPEAAAAASTLYNVEWDELYNINTTGTTTSTASDTSTYTVVHNPNSTSVTLEIKIFNMSNTLIKDVTGVTLNAHGTLRFIPQDYGIDPNVNRKGTMEIDSTGGPVLGFVSTDAVSTCQHLYQDYMSFQLFTPNDATPILYSVFFNNFYMNGTTVVTPSADGWNTATPPQPNFLADYLKGASVWYEIRNSSATTSIGLTDTWYNGNTGAITHGPAVDNTIPANGGLGFAAFQGPQYDLDKRGYVLITAPQATMFGAARAYNSMNDAYGLKMPISRSNIFYFENWQAPNSPSPTSGFTTFINLTNPNNASSTVTMTFYNEDGSLNTSANNPVTITMAPNTVAGIDPYRNGIYGSGSAVITATSPIMCYGMNYDYSLITSNYTNTNSAAAWDCTMHPQAPSVPSAVAGSTAGHITVTWIMSPDDPLNSLSQPKGAMDVIGYYIERATAYGGPYTVVGKVAAGTTTFDDGTATTGTTYHYKVAATIDNTHFSETTETIGVTAP